MTPYNQPRVTTGQTDGFHEVVDRFLDEKPTSREDAINLINADDTQLHLLCKAAAALRDSYQQKTISFSRNVFLPLTNLCRNTCGYCTFVKAPDNPAASTLTPEEVLAIALEGRLAGCKEALFSMGERPELKHELARQHLQQLGYPSMHAYLQEMCKEVFSQTEMFPHVNPGSLTYDEMADLRPWCVSMGMMLENASHRFLQKGQPHYGCPDKNPQKRLQTLQDAGKLSIPFTTGILIGIGETREERIDALLAIQKIKAEYGHIQEVIIQNFRSKPGTAMQFHPEPDTREMLLTLAAARLIFGGKMNIQAPPNLSPEEYGYYLEAGINDWGGISPISIDHINPDAAWPEIAELERITEEHGCTLRERLPVYPEYALDAERWLDDRFQRPVRAIIDHEGYVKANNSDEK